ncbi:glutathione S-transferase family protein [Thiofilum flexile]|uniref:glutathione S-transferase family protein n=1 Tax=Thiofilum flexile TaxID=125627 RepID=UPI00036C8DDF|nr:glutathione S-transferase family protein [Thiofilum flexile]
MHLYGCPMTRSTRAVWVLEEAGLAYDYTAIDMRAGESFKPPLITLNPAGKVPVLVDGDLVLTESAAICIYIGDKVPHSGLVPAYGTRERAVHEQWCFFAVSELEQPLWLIAKHSFAFPAEQRHPEVIPSAEWEFKRQLKILAQGLGDKTFILGESFTVADILLSHVLTWATRGLKMDLEHDNLKAYQQRTQARPALAKAREREAQAATVKTSG